MSATIMRENTVVTERPTTEEVMMRFAEILAHRSTCSRLRVGAVITDSAMLQVLGIGYNGNAKGLENGCDRPDEGNCGCLHAEINALLKAPGTLPGKRLFVTVSPCETCAKAAINSGITTVYYRTPYRSAAGVVLLRAAGVEVFQLDASDVMWTHGGAVS